MDVKLDGTVFIVEDVEPDLGSGQIYTGRFSAHHEGAGGDGVVGEIEDVTADEALAWGRARAPRVLIRTADGEYHWAGIEEVVDAPSWPPPQPVVRRRPRGQEWRDRTPDDDETEWAVEIALQPPYEEPRPDWAAAVAELAGAAGARGWGPGSPRVDLGEVALLVRDEPEDDHPGWDGLTYRVAFEIDAPTVEVAMGSAVRRLAAPPGWLVLAHGQPADRRALPVAASRWRVTGTWSVPPREGARVAAAFERELQATSSVVHAGVRSSAIAPYNALEMTAVVAVDDDGAAEAIVQRAASRALERLPIELGWMATAWSVRPA